MLHGRPWRVESCGRCCKSKSQERIDAVRAAAKICAVVEIDSHIFRVDKVAGTTKNY